MIYFTGHEKESDLAEGIYTTEYRLYDARVGRWLSVDPLFEKYVGMSPYNYCAGNPVMMVDVDGNEPKSILYYSEKAGFYRTFVGYTGGYKFKEATVHLLSLVSGVDKDLIKRVSIVKRGPGHYLPWYSAYNWGGGITLGDSRFNSVIVYTENFFEDNSESYNGYGFGQDVITWLSLSSHEVGHLKQIDEIGNSIVYYGKILGEYIKYGHDNAPMEKEVEKGRTNFTGFLEFTNNKYGEDSLKNLMENDKLCEPVKIRIIDEWWSEFTKNVTKNN